MVGCDGGMMAFLAIEPANATNHIRRGLLEESNAAIEDLDNARVMASRGHGIAFAVAKLGEEVGSGALVGRKLPHPDEHFAARSTKAGLVG